MVRDRVAALREANIYERQSYRHIVGMPAILGEDDGTVRAETPFLVARIMRDGTTDLFATGRYLDLLVEEAGRPPLPRAPRGVRQQPHRHAPGHPAVVAVD